MAKLTHPIIETLERGDHQEVNDFLSHRTRRLPKMRSPKVDIANAQQLSNMFQTMYEKWVLTTPEEDEQHHELTFDLGIDNAEQMQLYYSNYLYFYQQKYSEFGNLMMEHPRLFANLDVIHLYQFHRLCVALDQQEYARRQSSSWPKDFRALWELVKDAKTKCFAAMFELAPLRYDPETRSWFSVHTLKHPRKLAQRHQIYQVHEYLERHCCRFLNYTEFRNPDRIAKMKRLVPYFLPNHKNPLWIQDEDQDECE